MDVDVLRSLNSNGISLSEPQFKMYRAALHRMLTAVVALYTFIGMTEEGIEQAVMKSFVAGQKVPDLPPEKLEKSQAELQRQQLHEIEQYS